MERRQNAGKGFGNMGIFRRMTGALARFMYGRNGADQLCQAMVWGYIILFGLEFIFGAALKMRLPAQIFNGAGLVLLLLVLFRILSKNRYKRQAENQKWVNFVWRLKSRRQGARARHADKDHRYFTCKNCKTICRVPVGKGKIVITCPKCGAQIQAKT